MRRGHYAASVTRLAVSKPVDRFTVQLLDGGRVVATRWPAHGERIRAFRLDGFRHPLLSHRMLDLVQVAGADLGIEKMLTEAEVPASATRPSARAFTC